MDFVIKVMPEGELELPDEIKAQLVLVMNAKFL